MKLKTITKILAFSAFTLSSHNSFSQFTGDVDESFGDGGRLWYDWIGDGSTTTMSKLVLDESSESFYFSGSTHLDGTDDNAIIVKADLIGELDPELEEGTIIYNPSDKDDYFESIAIQPDGKIVAVGYTVISPTNTEVVITRFNPDGSFDPSFNGGSAINLSYGGFDFASDVAIQDDGKIVIIVSYQVSEDDLDHLLIRRNADGSADGTFSEDGFFNLDTYTGAEVLNSVTVLENGNIAAVGYAGDDLLVIQLKEDGFLDSDFAGDGTANFRVNSQPSAANKLIELSDGKLLLSGNTTNGEDGNNGFVVKMEADGALVFDFNGEDGTILLNFESEMGLDTNFFLHDMEVLPSGQILVAADYMTDTEDIGLVLINEDGELETEFGEGGMRLYILGDIPYKDAQIEVNSTGIVYLSGRIINGSFEDIVTLRLFGDISGLYEEEPAALNFNLYPNPTTNALSIEIDLTTSDDLSFQIVDLMGKVVANEQLMNVPAGQRTISISSYIEKLAAGSYWLSISIEGMTSTQLFVKK